MTDADLVGLAERLQVLCMGRHLSVAVAESCTGGLIAATITEVPGSSAYFRGGVVGYANAAKEDLLDVPRATLEAHGAVSAQVARAMAEGCRARLQASLAVAVTGIAGPDGGSTAKPVGLTYLAMASAKPTDVRRFVFVGDRAAVRAGATSEALAWLIAAAETT
ncbi:MAG TPA: nicotinamide-nucleotide amidohydrolase family protein [Candidatus Binatus sp.]|nr:nicotinamide-nucleotide amidohydrolase family protein [Candidatus Binatus sp.]